MLRGISPEKMRPWGGSWKTEKRAHTHRETPGKWTPADYEVEICRRNMQRGSTHKDSNNTLKRAAVMEKLTCFPSRGSPHSEWCTLLLGMRKWRRKRRNWRSCQICNANKRKVTDEMTIIRCLLNQMNKPLSIYNWSTFQDYKDYTVTLLIVF